MAAHGTAGRALRYAGGSARGLLHHVGGHDPLVAASALANKMARGIWAMLTRGEDYRGPAIGSAA